MFQVGANLYGKKFSTEKKMSDLKTVVDGKVSDPEEVGSNEEAENDPKDATSKKKKKKKRNKGK